MKMPYNGRDDGPIRHHILPSKTPSVKYGLYLVELLAKRMP